MPARAGDDGRECRARSTISGATALPRLADALAAAVAASLPWSTSATGILIALWLVASLPTLDIAALRREVLSAPGGLPVLLVALALARARLGRCAAAASACAASSRSCAC